MHLSIPVFKYISFHNKLKYKNFLFILLKRFHCHCKHIFNSSCMLQNDEYLYTHVEERKKITFSNPKVYGSKSFCTSYIWKKKMNWHRNYIYCIIIMSSRFIHRKYSSYSQSAAYFRFAHFSKLSKCNFIFLIEER